MMDGINDYLTYLRSKGNVEGTVYWKNSHLKAFHDYLVEKNITSFEVVTTEIIEAYLAYLKKRLKGRTVIAHLLAIKGLFSYLFKQNLIPADPAKEFELPKRGETLPKVLSEEEVLQLLAASDLHTPVGIRDRAILELLYSSGLRRKEVVDLNLTDLDLERGYVTVRQGKNQKDRVVPVGEVACKFIEVYLKAVRWWFLRDQTEQALFLDSMNGTRLSDNTIDYMVKKMRSRARLTKPVSAHMFRHSMASHLLSNGADIRHIQAILGHASVATTEVYTILAIDDLKKVHRQAHPHGKRPDSDSGQTSP